MRTLLRAAAVLTLAIALTTATIRAQFVVYDPTNYAQALSTYAQLVEEYRFFVAQATRIPIDLLARYHVTPVAWSVHPINPTTSYATALVSGLNAGDASGALYRSGVDPLDNLDPLLPTVPPSLQRRLALSYGNVQLTDTVASTAVTQVGLLRTIGPATISAIQNTESDAASAADSYNSQVAVLNKINGTDVLALRLHEANGQFLMHILEQLLVQNIRTRDADAAAMNARLEQWRYGAAYGRDLFSRTASTLDSWRLP